jgi:hypothetical protein
VDPLAHAFDPIHGLPSWEVRRGHGSFVTLEFGEPSVEISDVQALPARIAGERLQVPRRSAYVHGEWHLWIYCCEWTLSWRDRQIAHSESSDLEMNRGLKVLNGQSLTAVTAGSPDGRSSFAFDLDCVLATRPSENAADDLEQWMFFQPSGDVLSLRADGQLHSGRADEP